MRDILGMFHFRETGFNFNVLSYVIPLTLLCTVVGKLNRDEAMKLTQRKDDLSKFYKSHR